MQYRLKDMIKYIFIKTWKELLVICVLCIIGYYTILSDIFFTSLMSVYLMSLILKTAYKLTPYSYIINVLFALLMTTGIMGATYYLKINKWYVYIIVILISIFFKRFILLSDYIEEEEEREKNSNNKGVFR